MPTTPRRNKALYPKCAEHITRAGLTLTEAAQRANISTSSVSRMCKEQEVLVTTISKMINALNDYHFTRHGRPLTLENEMRALPPPAA